MKINTRLNIKFNDVIIWAFLFFIFFPYIQIIPLPADMQPYALIMGIIITLKYINKEFPITLFLLFVLLIYSGIILIIFSDFNLQGIKAVVSYGSLFFISFSVFHLLNANNINLDKIIGIVCHLWFFVGLLQITFLRYFFSFLLYRTAPTTGLYRGVASLSPEPTFYGIICIFLILIVVFTGHKHKTYLISMLLLQIFVLAKSPMIILLVFILASYYVLFHLSCKTIFVLCLILFATIISWVILMKFASFQYFFLNSRGYELYVYLTHSPSNLLHDQSINHRLAHVFFSLLGFQSNWMLPNGYSQFGTCVQSLLPDYLTYFPLYNDAGNQIMSGYGSAFFQLGVIGLIVPCVITVTLLRFFKDNFRDFLTYAFFINTIMFAAIPLSLPYLSFIIGYMCHSVYVRKREIGTTHLKRVYNITFEESGIETSLHKC